MTTDTVRAFVALLPQHKASLHLTHNDHRAGYETIPEYTRNNNLIDDWVSPEEREKAIREDSLWVLHWYPDTPIGSYSVCASSLEAVIAAAGKVGGKKQ